jgi:flagellar L-ring protein precursor FlgH
VNRMYLASLLAGGALAAGAQAESLYDAQNYRALVSNKRALRAGDLVTVLVYENSSATTAADTSLHRDSNAALRGGIDQRQHSAGLGSGNDFSGGGTVQRSGKLLAQLTVTVTGIAPNGDLWVSGEQLVEVNADKQQIKVQGRVRAVDISDANTVQSSRLADAHITYAGDGGDLAARQKPGWLSKVLVWMGL